MSRIVRVTEAVRITEYADGTSAREQAAVEPMPAELPRGYNAETDSPLAGRTSHRLRWTGPISEAEREQIRQRVEAARPRRRRWFG